MQKIIQLFDFGDDNVKFEVRWKDADSTDFVDRRILNSTHPQEVIRFYQSRIIFMSKLEANRLSHQSFQCIKNLLNVINGPNSSEKVEYRHHCKQLRVKCRLWLKRWQNKPGVCCIIIRNVLQIQKNLSRNKTVTTHQLEAPNSLPSSIIAGNNIKKEKVEIAN